MFLSILCSIKIERLLFLKFLKILAFFDSYFWPFNKTHEKIIAIFVISAIIIPLTWWKTYWPSYTDHETTNMRKIDIVCWANTPLSWPVRLPLRVWSGICPVKWSLWHVSRSSLLTLSNWASSFYHSALSFVEQGRILAIEKIRLEGKIWNSYIYYIGPFRY